MLRGAMTDQQAARVQQLVQSAGQQVEFHVFLEMPHSMHGTDPDRYASLLMEWAARLPSEAAVRQTGIFSASERVSAG
jgi:hypothetical protein